MNANNIFNDPIFLQTRKICKLMYQKGWNAGRNLDETFGLIETTEKAAEIYIKIYNKRVKQILTNSQLKELALAFKLNFNEEFLK